LSLKNTKIYLLWSLDCPTKFTSLVRSFDYEVQIDASYMSRKFDFKPRYHPCTFCAAPHSGIKKEKAQSLDQDLQD
jgi:hypothetical protein